MSVSCKFYFPDCRSYITVPITRKHGSFETILVLGQAEPGYLVKSETKETIKN